MDLLLATHNRHKTCEISEILGPGFQVRDLNDNQAVTETAETGATFVENATIKALTVSERFRDVFVLADDSGLEVDALRGAPGIFSARYAGEMASDRENVAKLLREMANTSDRGAQFCCVLVLARKGTAAGTFHGQVRGHITTQASGESGFGYDPVFVPEGFLQTFAQMPAKLKNEMSHRARALAQLRKYFCGTALSV